MFTSPHRHRPTADSGSSPFLLWFLAAGVRFLRVYHCNQQARPAVSQAAWNKAARKVEHKVGEAFVVGYWDEKPVLCLGSDSLSLFSLLRQAKHGRLSTPLRRGAWIPPLQLVQHYDLTPYTVRIWEYFTVEMVLIKHDCCLIFEHAYYSDKAKPPGSHTSNYAITPNHTYKTKECADKLSVLFKWQKV